MGGCQNYGPFLGPWYYTAPVFRGPKGDHNFDNHPYSTLYNLYCEYIKSIVILYTIYYIFCMKNQNRHEILIIVTFEYDLDTNPVWLFLCRFSVHGPVLSLTPTVVAHPRKPFRIQSRPPPARGRSSQMSGNRVANPQAWFPSYSNSLDSTPKQTIIGLKQPIIMSHWLSRNSI